MSGWTADDFAAVAEATGLGGFRTIYPWPDRPHLGITLDMRPMGLLAASGAVDNPHLTQVLRAMRETSARAAELEAGDETATVEWYELQDRVLDYHDEILRAIVKDPPWCPKADVPPNGITPGKLNIYMLSNDVRRMLVELPNEGPSVLGSLFRQSPNGTGPTPDGARLRSAAEPLVSDAPAAPEVLDRSSDVVRLGDVRDPGSGDARAAGPASDAVA